MGRVTPLPPIDIREDMMVFTRVHMRLVDAWLDLYMIQIGRGATLRTLNSWLGAKFGPEVNMDTLTVPQARQARRCLRAWAWFDIGSFRKVMMATKDLAPTTKALLLFMFAHPSGADRRELIHRRLIAWDRERQEWCPTEDGKRVAQTLLDSGRSPLSASSPT